MTVSSASEWKMKICPSHPPLYVLVCSNTMESCSGLWLLTIVLTVCFLEPGEGTEKRKDGILHPICLIPLLARLQIWLHCCKCMFWTQPSDVAGNRIFGYLYLRLSSEFRLKATVAPSFTCT